MSVPANPSDAANAGRRRSELLRRGAATARAAALTMADVAGLRASRRPATRAAIAAKFGRQFDELAEGEHRDPAQAVLRLLVRDVETEVRRSLAEAVAASPNLPSEVARRLAHDDIDVARPILERSPVLDDEELMDIVRTHAMQYAVAVAGRETVSEAVSEALADTDDREVALRLVCNLGARLSVRTMTRLAEDHRDDPEVERRLVRRPALPYEMVERLAGMVADRLGLEPLRSQAIPPALARRLVHGARDRAASSLVARERGDQGPEHELRRRYLNGLLGPEEVLAFLREGDVDRFEAGMALLAEVEAARARRLLYNGDRRLLAALCLRAGFPAPIYVLVRVILELAEQSVSPGRRRSGYSSQAMRSIHRQYEHLRVNDTLLEELMAA